MTWWFSECCWPGRNFTNAPVVLNWHATCRMWYRPPFCHVCEGHYLHVYLLLYSTTNHLLEEQILIAQARLFLPKIFVDAAKYLFGIARCNHCNSQVTNSTYSRNSLIQKIQQDEYAFWNSLNTVKARHSFRSKWFNLSQLKQSFGLHEVRSFINFCCCKWDWRTQRSPCPSSIISSAQFLTLTNVQTILLWWCWILDIPLFQSL